ncbi:MAG: hypothetical protein MO853_12625 [Candidatus Protistobacter heckmanni]|nr:hypothetical protein [Candidatus Protistobacter heckmanni]
MTARLPARISATFSAALALALAGCAVGPDYKRPETPIQQSFKEAPGLRLAKPGDEAPRGKWWEAYGDTVLNGLMEQVDISNQNIRPPRRSTARRWRWCSRRAPPFS